MLSACADVRIIDSGYGKLVDYDCNPVISTEIKVSNSIRGSYLMSGDSDKSLITTDKNGAFEFDIGGNVGFIGFTLMKPKAGTSSLLRKFDRTYVGDPHNEFQEILNTSLQSPLLLYVDDGGNIAPYGDNKEVYTVGGAFDRRYKSTIISNGNVRVGNLRFGKKDRQNVIILNAFNDGDISTITKVSTHGIEVSNTSGTHIIENIKEDSEHLFYIRYGNKNHAAIVTMHIIYHPVSDSVTIKYYSQLVPAITISDNQYVQTNLEECGGHMDRGVLGYYAKISDEKRQKIRASDKPVKVNKMQEILKEIDYIETQRDLNALINRPGLDEITFIKLLQYDIIRVDLFDNLYPFAGKNNWHSLVRSIGMDPRASESVIIDIIDKTPVDDRMTPTYLKSYILNPSANAAAISTAIRIFEAAPRTDSEFENIVEAILKDGSRNREAYKAYTPALDDIKTIQSFLEARYSAITDSQQKTNLASELKWSPFTSSSLIEKAYHQLKKTGKYKYELPYWVNHPNTPISVLKLIAEYPPGLEIDNPGNQKNTHKLITALLDHPNASAELRNEFYAVLDNKNTDQQILKYYIAPGIAGATTNPDVIFERLVKDALANKVDGGFRVLLNNPSLPLDLSEKLVAKHGCPYDSINETYARVHFQKIPDKSCYGAALNSKITPDSVKRKILEEYKVGKNSERVKTVQIPPEQMQFLYCVHKGYVMEKLAYNSYTSENIFVDLFKNSHRSGIIEILAANPATPQWIIERIYNNDYVVRMRSNTIERKLSCNPRLPKNIRKHLKYQHPYQGCRNNIVDNSIIQHIKSRKKANEAIDCDSYKRQREATEIPEITITDYGVIEFKTSETGKVMEKWTGVKSEDGAYQVVNQTTSISKKLGLEFGIMFSVSGYFPDGYVDIEDAIIYPEGGLTNPSTGITKKTSSGKLRIKLNEGRVYSFTFDHPWEIKPGKWVFRLKYKNSVVAEKTFMVEY